MSLLETLKCYSRRSLRTAVAKLRGEENAKFLPAIVPRARILVSLGGLSVYFVPAQDVDIEF